MGGTWAFFSDFLYYTWFIWAFLLLRPLAVSTWLGWRQRLFEHRIDWSMMEVLIPREIKTSPKAMEQVVLHLWSFKNYPGDIREKWWDGEVTLWHSLEIAAYDGEVHFYIRTPKRYKDLTEAAFYAYYPDIEIVDADDYMDRLPKTVQGLYAERYRTWGTEIILDKTAAYPIRNYTDFESPDENKEYDPMSGFIEVLSKLKKDQFVAIQILIQPAMVGDPHDAHAIKRYQEEVIKVRERKQEGAPSAKLKFKFSGILPTLEPVAPTEEPSVAGSLRRAIMTRTPGEVDVLTAMEESLARPMFNTMIRYIYASPFEDYTEHFPRRALFGAFGQYNAVDINSLTRNKPTMTRGKIWEWPVIFPDTRKEYRRQRIWYNFRHREMPPHRIMGRLLVSYLLNWYFASRTIHLSTRSIATLWHPPTHQILTGPHIRRVESKKAGPPAGVEIFGEESQIQKFT